MRYLVLRTKLGKHAIPENAVVSIRHESNGGWVIETARCDYGVDERPIFMSEDNALNQLDSFEE